MTTTNYIVKKQCMQCDHTNETDQKRCSSCGFLFIREATPEEKAEHQSKIRKLKATAQERAYEDI